MKLAPKDYDPNYDPLMTKTPSVGQDYAPTYWIGTAGKAPEDDGPVLGNMDADVVIIGSGFTGLACAIFLAREYGIKATVLEANQSSWGCSTRNGGQAQCSTGRLKRSQWIQRWGKDEALKLHHEVCDAMELFKDLIKDIDCDPQPNGHLYMAHKKNVMPSLRKESAILNDVFGYQSRIIEKDELKEKYINDHESYGAMYEPEGIGIHAGKLAFAYLKMARDLGVKVHTSSAVVSWESKEGVHYLQTRGGQVKARSVAVATGGYTTPELNKNLRSRLLPILSNSIVTRPLSKSELEEAGLHSHILLTDTRILRHYYRLLPDNRLQIGSRSSITGLDASNKKYEQNLINDMHRKFPSLKNVKIDYSWWGWVDVAHDMMPRIFQPEKDKQIFYAMGYGGNGVMYSAQAGRRLAQLIAGKGGALEAPIFKSQLPFPNLFNKFESPAFAPFRRVGQRFLYRWYHIKDEYM
jgi:glycine/D-amino acid oxidase-like deaminating enzyme